MIGIMYSLTGFGELWGFANEGGGGDVQKTLLLPVG